MGLGSRSLNPSADIFCPVGSLRGRCRMLSACLRSWPFASLRCCRSPSRVAVRRVLWPSTLGVMPSLSKRRTRRLPPSSTSAHPTRRRRATPDRAPRRSASATTQGPSGSSAMPSSRVSPARGRSGAPRSAPLASRRAFPRVPAMAFRGSVVGSGPRTTSRATTWRALVPWQAILGSTASVASSGSSEGRNGLGR